MSETYYYPEVECEARPSDLYETAVVGVPDERDNRHYLRVAQGLVHQVGDQVFLPVGIVDVDQRNHRALIQLPYEADSGANMLWIPFRRFRHSTARPEESELVV